MMGSELDAFLAQLDEISTDSASVDSYQLQMQKSENKKLKSLLLSMKDATKEMLGLYKSERQITIQLQGKLDSAVHDYNELQRRYDELERTNVNKVFSLTEIMNEMKEKQAKERENYVELSKDYFDTLSDATCLFNYEIKKPQNRIISKTERFLRDCLGDEFKKPKILQSKRMRCSDSDSVISSTSSRVSKRLAKASNEGRSKRLKTEIWDMKSISQASSPAGILLDEETFDLSSDIGGADSSYSFNTFSIGNESTFSLLQSQQSPTAKKIVRCRCHLFAENELVSIGVNTDEPEQALPSLPLLDEAFEYEIDTLDPPEIDIEPCETSEDCKETIDHVKVPVSYATASTNTEDEAPKIREMVDQATSPVAVETSDKSTVTVRSTTTRGTSTISPEKKNTGVQFPEITLENIFSETIFDLPDCLSPIEDEPEVLKKEMKAIGTITELCNVNREIDYVRNMKTESLSIEDLLATRNQEEESFIILGQTLFDLFLKRIRKSNETLSDDEITRRKIWKHLKRQLLDRFSELTFDETLNSSNSDLETQERMMSFEEAISSRVKEGLEEFVVEPEESIEHVKSLENISTDLSVKSLNDNSTVEDFLQSEMNDSATLKGSSEDLPDSSRSPSPELLKSMCDESIELTSEALSFAPAENVVSNQEVSSFASAELEAFESVMKSLDQMLSQPLIEPLDDLCDVVWSSMFPQEVEDVDSSPKDSEAVLNGFDLEHEPIEIPTESDMEVADILCQSTAQIFGEFDSPKSPTNFMAGQEAPYTPTFIPIEKLHIPRNLHINFERVFGYNQHTRMALVQWQQNQQINTQIADKQLSKTRKAIQIYLDSEWTDESVDVCRCALRTTDTKILLEAIYETVEDHKDQTEICTEFSPPAPPLPKYQQKLILLINKLTELDKDLPHLLLEDLEEKLLKLENAGKPLDDLRNLSYYYTALVDLFFEGDSTMVFYFIVKCIYIFGFKSIPMVFVLIKAFPRALPKKSLLLKKFNTTIDWENMTGLELSKVQFDINCMDSLDLTVMYLLTNVTQYNRKSHESYAIRNHELFNYLPKFYGFSLSFMAAPRLLDILMKRLANGELENLSLSLILLAKRSNAMFVVRTMVKGQLLVVLEKLVAKLISTSNHSNSPLVAQVCLLLEVISSIAKTHTEEKCFKEIFPTFVSVLGRVNNDEVKESCIKAILRIQRLIDTPKEILGIINHYVERSEEISEGLRLAISTFIHRKDEKFFKAST